MNIRDRVKELRRVPASELRPNPKNWRTHPAGQADALRGILAEVGFAGAALAYELPDGTLQLIDGHLRAETVTEQPIPVLVLDVTQEEADKLLATFDPLSAMAVADSAKLDALLREVQTSNEALAGMLTELATEAGCEWGQAETPAPGGGGDEFDATPAEGPTRTAVGDLWVIGGKHRLLVGDCTDAENVARLMEGAKASLCFTDPPYNQAEFRDMGVADIRPASYGALADAKWDKGFNFAEAATPLLSTLAENAAVYVCMSEFIAPAVWAWMAEWSDYYSYCVWCKPNPMPSLTKKRWTWGTELIAYGTRGKLLFNFPADGHALNWWDIPVNQAGREHPTQKPVQVPERAITHSSDQGDIVYDPFLGSGTTLIAAHRLGRTCYGCELEPRYADVVLRRAEAEGLTVEKAT